MDKQEFTELKRINKRLEIVEQKLDDDISTGMRVHSELGLDIELIKQKFNHIKWICVGLPPAIAVCVGLVSLGLQFLNLSAT